MESSTPPVTPLPMCVELAKQMRGQWDGEVGAAEADAKLIDAKVRPLVELLQQVTSAWDNASISSANGDEEFVYNLGEEFFVNARAALRDAGVE